MNGLDYHGPGDRMDAHNHDTSAHGGSFMAASAVVPPKILTPPSAVNATSVAAWYGVNNATFMRVQLPVAGTYRYMNFWVGTSSGNVQFGVVKLAPSGGATSINGTRVMDSGSIACPASGAVHYDLGATPLATGEYGLFLWCDNTTATFAHGLATGFQADRLGFGGQAYASGIGSSVLTLPATTRYVRLSLEADGF